MWDFLFYGKVAFIETKTFKAAISNCIDAAIKSS